jgi:NitT/TauT family transport system substrate-binding protein
MIRLFVSAAMAVGLVTAIPATAQTNDPVVRIGMSAADNGAPILYAVKAGLFKKYGVNVEVIKLGGSAPTAAALAGGSLELGSANPIAVVTAYGKGLPFTVVGEITSYDSTHPDVALVVSAASAIKSPKDLEGKTLGSNSLGDMNSISVLTWLSQRGVDTSTIKQVEVPPSAALAALDQNRIAGATVNEPFYSAAVATGRVRVLGYPYDAFGKRVANGLIFANIAWANEHRDVVERFMRALQEASAYIGAHENESAALVAQFGGADPAMMANVRHPRRGAAVDPADIQPMIDIAARYKLIPKAFPAEDIICTCALRK